MARKHYAKALVSKVNIDQSEWSDSISDSHAGIVSKNNSHRIAKTILRKCDPKQFLLSHATIVASVDTYSPTNVKIAKQLNRGIQIDVKFPDFRVKPACNYLINNNGDFWSRPLLLSTYRTFVGANSYVEHIQIPELSKGFIVDAVARDLEDSVYIDILVANDRKHERLIQDILSGELNSLSMGCISAFTICSKCGNVASDDASTCPCILYDGKGSKFITEDGVEHVVGELIGHVSIPNSNQFIEASWVKNPAFKGAVRRNFLNSEMDQDHDSHLASKLDSSSFIHDIKSMEKLPDDFWNRTASTVRTAEDEPEPEKEPEKSVEENKSSKDKLDDMLAQAEERILQSLIDRLSDKLIPKPEDVGVVNTNVEPVDLTSLNDSLLRGASSNNVEAKFLNLFPSDKNIGKKLYSRWIGVHTGGRKFVSKNKITSSELIILSWAEDRINGREGPTDLYKLALKVGKLKDYPSEKSYLAVCKMQSSRSLSELEEAFLIRKGRIASLSTVSNFNQFRDQRS